MPSPTFAPGAGVGADVSAASSLSSSMGVTGTGRRGAVASSPVSRARAYGVSGAAGGCLRTRKAAPAPAANSASSDTPVASQVAPSHWPPK